MDAARNALGVGKGVARAVSVAFIASVMLALAAWLWPWVRELAPALRWRLAIAAAVFVSGALGLEVLSRVGGDGGVVAYLSPTPHAA